MSLRLHPTQSPIQQAIDLNMAKDLQRDYGASGTPVVSTVDIAAGSTTLSISQVNPPNPSFNDGQMLFIMGAGPVTTNMGTVASGGAMSAVAMNGTGTTNRTFWISYVNPADMTISEAASVSCANGPASLTSTSSPYPDYYIQLTWGASLPYNQAGYLIWGDSSNPADSQGFLGFSQAENFMWYGGIGNSQNTLGIADNNGVYYSLPPWQVGNVYPDPGLFVPINPPTAPVPGPLANVTVVSGGGTQTLTIDKPAINSVTNAGVLTDDTPAFLQVANNSSLPLNIPYGTYTIQGISASIAMDATVIEGNGATIRILPFGQTSQGLSDYITVLGLNSSLVRNLNFNGSVGYWGNPPFSFYPNASIMQINNSFVIDTCNFIDGSAFMINIPGNDGTFRNCTFTAYLGAAIILGGNSNVIFENCTFTGCAQECIWVLESTGSVVFRDCIFQDTYGRFSSPNSSGYVLYANGSKNFLFDNCQTINVVNSVVLANSNGGLNPGNIRLRDCKFGTSPSLLNLQNASNVLIDNCDLTAFAGNSNVIQNSNSTGIVFRDCPGYNPVGYITPPASPLISGTVYQNTYGVPITVYQPVYATTAGTNGSVVVSVGTTSTPATLYTKFINGATTSTMPEVITFRVFTEQYYSLATTGVTLLDANIQGE